MSTPHESKCRVTLAAMALALIAGCSALPTAPGPEMNAGTAVGDERGTAPAAMVAPQSATSTKTIYGTIGGTVSAGDFTVVFPPLAISGTATVTVHQADLSKPYVDLEISPASANKFRLPVTLVANAARMDDGLLKVAYLSWYNPKTRRWEKVLTSSVNLVNRTVLAELRHFSKYRVESGGKAGW